MQFNLYMTQKFELTETVQTFIPNQNDKKSYELNQPHISHLYIEKINNLLQVTSNNLEWITMQEDAHVPEHNYQQV